MYNNYCRKTLATEMVRWMVRRVRCALRTSASLVEDTQHPILSICMPHWWCSIRLQPPGLAKTYWFTISSSFQVVWGLLNPVCNVQCKEVIPCSAHCSLDIYMLTLLIAGLFCCSNMEFIKTLRLPRKETCSVFIWSLLFSLTYGCFRWRNLLATWITTRGVSIWAAP